MLTDHRHIGFEAIGVDGGKAAVIMPKQYCPGGAMGFLQKPFTLEAFKKKLEACMA